MYRFLFRLFVLSILILSACQSTTKRTKTSQGTFLALSDIHYDSSREKPINPLDSSHDSFKVLKKQLEHLMKTNQLDPDFVIIAGDFLAHQISPDNHKNFKKVVLYAAA